MQSSRKFILSCTLTGSLLIVGSSAFAAEETSEVTSSPTPTVETTVDDSELDVRILSTTDLHTNLVNYDYYQDQPSEKLGLAKTAVLIKEAKEENSNTLLVDNGDTIQGTPLGTYKAIVDPVEAGENHPMYKALESLDYDAATLGNHEFNYGLEFLDTVISGTKLPIVNANVIDETTGTYRYTPYKILNKTYKDNHDQDVELKIGITGIVPPQIMTWDKAHLEGKVHVEDSVEAVTKMVPVLRQEGADLVVVLSHSGIGDNKYEKGEENVGYQIANIPGVDAVITGHSHAEFPSRDGKGIYEKIEGVDGTKGQILGTPVVMAGKYGDNLGIIDLKLKKDSHKKWKVSDSKGFLRRIDDKSTTVDTNIVADAKVPHENTINYVRQEVGTTTDDITSYFALVKDNPSVQIVNNAQIWYAKKELAGTPEGNLPILSAAAPFKAGARGDATSFTDIAKGSIAIKNVADLYLYDNVTAIVKVNGQQLKEWLEMSAGQFKQIDPSITDAQDLINTSYRTYNFDVIDGITYKIDITQPNKYDYNAKLVNEQASRIKDLQYQGKDIKPDQEFIVVTNNYRAFGTFPGVKDASFKRLLNLENRQAIINYITQEKVINPSADNNWTFADTIKGLNLTFGTAEKAKSLIHSDDIVFDKTGENGFGIFKYVYQAPKMITEVITKPQINTTVKFKDHIQNQTTITKESTSIETAKSTTTMSQQTKSISPVVVKHTVNVENTTSPQAASMPKTMKATQLQEKHLTNNKTLPKTGQSSHQSSLLGGLLLTVLALFKIRKNTNI